VGRNGCHPIPDRQVAPLHVTAVLTAAADGEWEYLRLDLNDARPRQDDVDMLNRAGSQGWELVAITPSGVAYLKREIEG